jgi:hypothetical protein
MGQSNRPSLDQRDLAGAFHVAVTYSPWSRILDDKHKRTELVDNGMTERTVDLTPEQRQRKRTASSRYRKSAKGREKVRRYRQSEKGRAAKRRFDQSAKGRAAQRRYNESAKGHAAQRRYDQSLKGVERDLRHKQSKGRRAPAVSPEPGRLPPA